MIYIYIYIYILYIYIYTFSMKSVRGHFSVTLIVYIMPFGTHYVLVHGSYIPSPFFMNIYHGCLNDKYTICIITFFAKNVYSRYRGSGYRTFYFVRGDRKIIGISKEEAWQICLIGINFWIACSQIL